MLPPSRGQALYKPGKKQRGAHTNQLGQAKLARGTLDCMHTRACLFQSRLSAQGAMATHRLRLYTCMHLSASFLCLHPDRRVCCPRPGLRRQHTFVHHAAGD
ncbi:unnamed protein product [Protopolystoma xenopodis]|uniref:Uncharacterized protein n=1 Tax=Protopolystoma xenopodis TaxID=117903 RepID=A0A3S5CIB3_9PLAT|nr:unnamed protein product [Protopolystoma xenopodis]